jgi:hypothetical protein
MDTAGLVNLRELTPRDSSSRQAHEDSKLLALLGFLTSPTQSSGSAELEERGAESLATQQYESLGKSMRADGLKVSNPVEV